MSDSPRTVPLRRLSAPESPMPGLLIAGTPPTVWTDAALWEGHPAWRADPEGHLLAPIDAGAGDGEAGVIVPYCPDRLRTSLDRRGALSPGEAVTLTVSILRGVAEADALGIDTGTWWVTADGRPVGAAGSGAPLREEAIALLAELASEPTQPLSRAVEHALAALRDARRLRLELPALEAALFAAAEPAPLAPMENTIRARSVSASLRADAARPRATTDDEPHPSESAATIHDFILRFVDAAWADRVTSTLESVRVSVTRRRRSAPAADGPPSSTTSASRTDSTPPRRRRRVIVASSAGAAVLALGLAWPTADVDDAPRQTGTSVVPADSAMDDPGPPSAAEPDPDRPSPTATVPAPAPSRSPESEDDGDLRSVAAGLLRRLSACASSGCDSDIVEDPSRSLAHTSGLGETSPTDVTLIDQYGGVAVLELGSDGDRTLIVVIVQVDEKWLVRDVYDVADQPS